VKKLNEQASTSTNNNTMLVAEQSNGWTLVSDSQANLDAFTQATGGKLADDKTYQDAIGTLDSDALVKAYVDGTKVGSAAKAAGAAATPALPRFQTAVAELVARDDGLQLKGDVKTSGKPLARSYTPKLLGVVPAGALAVVSFRAVQGAPAAVRQMPAVPGLGAVLQSLGRLAPIFSGENVIFVSPGFPIPEVTVVAEPTKVAAAAASVDRLIASLRPLLGNASVKQTSLDGVPARQVDFGRFSIYYGTTAGRLFISSSPRVVAQLRSDGQKLADDATFKEAKKAAGMGDTSAGFVYVNLKDAIPLLEGVAALSGSKLPADVDQNIRHLRTLLVYGDGSGGDTRFSAFLGVS
jgi:hypothetical protein